MTKGRRSAGKRIRLAIIESDPLRVAGFRTLLVGCDDLEFLPLCFSEIHPDLDVDVAILGKRHGYNLGASLQRLRTVLPALRVIVSASGTSDDVIMDALVNGAKGYVEEAAPVSEFVSAIRVVNQGLIWAPRRVMGILIIRYSQGRTGLFGERITMREREVLEMLVAGRSNREIARPLGIAERTVKSHVAKLMRKVGVQNRIALSMHAVKHSLVAWDEPKSATSPTNQAVQ